MNWTESDFVISVELEELNLWEEVDWLMECQLVTEELTLNFIDKLLGNDLFQAKIMKLTQLGDINLGILFSSK